MTKTNVGSQRELNATFKTWIFGELNRRIPAGPRRKNPKHVLIVACLILSDKRVREVGGNNRGTWVGYLQDTIGGISGEAWCMAAVQTLVAVAEEYTGCKSYLASSSLYGSEHCLTVLAKSPLLVVDEPARGCITIYQYGKTSNGHTGIILALTKDGFLQAEGNTDSGDAVNREGDGFYTKRRLLKGYGEARIVGFIDPFPEYSVDPQAA